MTREEIEIYKSIMVDLIPLKNNADTMINFLFSLSENELDILWDGLQTNPTGIRMLNKFKEIQTKYPGKSTYDIFYDDLD